MKKLKFWTASIVSGFDSVISKVENHESVVTSSIQELQEAAAHAKVKLNRLKQEIQRMRSKLSELKQNRERWNERALSLRDTDKNKAVECLRHRKRVEAEISHLENEIPTHTNLAENIESDVRKLQSKIEDLKLRKRAFSTRASRAQAMKICGNTQGISGEQLEDTFERWEMKLAETEVTSNISTDSLEDEFIREEEQDALLLELEELEGPIAEETQKQN